MADERKDISALAALDDELRRKMYQLIRHARKPLSREDVSRELGISVKLSAFHLDKLVDRRLLKAHYARRADKSGPGAGRSSKFYEPSDREIQISIPPREYSLIGSLLIGAFQKLGVKAQSEEAVDLARLKGRELGARLGSGSRKQTALTSAKKRLGRLGYEPYGKSPTQIALQNCPFSELSSQAPDLVCPLNKALVEGVLLDVEADVHQASVGPSDEGCCVSVTIGSNKSRRSQLR
jgi:predicted ArsR family transcriptional regulator